MMKMRAAITSIIFAFLFFSCTDQSSNHGESKEADGLSSNISKPEFQSILDSANVKGAILIYDFQKDLYYSNDFDWCKKGQLPASTFKIPNSIIALETGVVENDSTLFEWDGEPKRLKSWEQDLVFRDAFQFSCVPCYQEIARGIGTDRMVKHLEKLQYGNIKVDTATIDNFWLVGESKITPFEQIDFLKRLYQSELPISEKTEQLVKDIMVIERQGDYQLSGKTGWSINNDINNGWFVGYVQSNGNVHFFATNVEPKKGFDMSNFPAIRKEVTFEAFYLMKNDE